MVKEEKEGKERAGTRGGGPTCHSTNHFGAIVQLAL